MALVIWINDLYQSSYAVYMNPVYMEPIYSGRRNKEREMKKITLSYQVHFSVVLDKKLVGAAIALLKRITV